ncbi:MAG: hypothetical protein DA328_09320 [Nitrososphaeraceae archaeon]|nr:hypothetical protein [Nitrososphaeraceae archaeon]
MDSWVQVPPPAFNDLYGGFNRYNNANSDNYKKMKLDKQFTTAILTTNTNIFEKVIRITKL